MKIVIDIEESKQYGLAPYSVYRALYMEYGQKKKKEHGNDFWGMANSCDCAARELYSHITGRKVNVTNLILTYHDAEKCFSLFQSFADVWVDKLLE